MFARCCFILVICTVKLLLQSFSTAAENLAFEEWFFDHFTEETLRLWISPPSVVVGKHQNAFAEHNPQFCAENGIPVVRRISGGGTVFHDTGNINFSFFRFVEKGRQIDYDSNLDIIQNALHFLGYEVSRSPRHDLFLGDKKISGNAQHVGKGRALHHGTILYSANHPALSAALKNTLGVYTDKAVKSVRSPVANLSDTHLLGSATEFMVALAAATALETTLVTGFEEGIAELVAQKYTQWDWNFGYGPAFTFAPSGTHILIGVDRGGEIVSVTRGGQPYEPHNTALKGRLCKKEEWGINSTEPVFSVVREALFSS